MPLNLDELGTNTDGSPNQDYCHFCFQNGTFTEPDVTMAQMVGRVADILVTNVSDATLLRTLLRNLQGILHVGLTGLGVLESTTPIPV